MGPAERPQRLARLDLDGSDLFALVAAFPGADALGHVSPSNPADRGRADHLGGLEYIRAYFLSGFPWYYLAHSQYRRLYLIQVADFTGSLGISLLIVVFNALVVDLLSLPLLHVDARAASGCSGGQNIRLCLVTILLGSTFCYGAFRLSTAAFRDGPRLALLQSNIPQRHKMKGDPAKIIARFAALDRARSRAGQRPDLIVWPETSYPYGYIAIDPSIDPATLERQVRSITTKITAEDWIEAKNEVADQLHPGPTGSACRCWSESRFYDHRKERAREVQFGDPRSSPIVATIRHLPQDASGAVWRVCAVYRHHAVAGGS